MIRLNNWASFCCKGPIQLCEVQRIDKMGQSGLTIKTDESDFGKQKDHKGRLRGFIDFWGSITGGQILQQRLSNKKIK